MDKVLYVLPFLVCPLMMLVCMVPMLLGRKKSCHDCTTPHDLTPEQVHERLIDLQRQELALRERLQPLDNPHDETTTDSPVGRYSSGSS